MPPSLVEAVRLYQAGGLRRTKVEARLTPQPLRRDFSNLKLNHKSIAELARGDEAIRKFVAANPTK